MNGSHGLLGYLPILEGQWASLGIEKFIELTIVNTSLDLELMSLVLRFWSTVLTLSFSLLVLSPSP